MGKMRILAVDDNTINLATIEQELKDTYEVIPMLSGRRAVRYLYSEKVDLILLDVQMPVMDGIETLKEIRKLENGITVPVIFLTAMKDKNTVIEGSKLGIMDYVTKPFDITYLMSRIESAFKKLGIMPIEENDLLESLKGIAQDIRDGKSKAAILKVDEVLGYQIEEEILGRMRNVRLKLEKGDLEGADKMVKRILRMMGTQVENLTGNGITLTTRELYAKVLYIKEYIESFKTKEAIEQCKEVLQFNFDEDLRDSIQQAMDKLLEYDDEEAEQIIHCLVDKMGKKII